MKFTFECSQETWILLYQNLWSFSSFITNCYEISHEIMGGSGGGGEVWCWRWCGGGGGGDGMVWWWRWLV